MGEVHALPLRTAGAEVIQHEENAVPGSGAHVAYPYG
jgi:hypothetical protein